MLHLCCLKYLSRFLDDVRASNLCANFSVPLDLILVTYAEKSAFYDWVRFE